MSEFQTMILVTTVLGVVAYFLLFFITGTLLYLEDDESEESLWKNLVIVLVPLLIVVPAAISIDKHLCVNDKLYFVGEYTTSRECELYELMEEDSYVRTRVLKVRNADSRGIHSFHLSSKVVEKSKMRKSLGEKLSFPVFTSLEDAVIYLCTGKE